MKSLFEPDHFQEDIENAIKEESALLKKNCFFAILDFGLFLFWIYKIYKGFDVFFLFLAILVFFSCCIESISCFGSYKRIRSLRELKKAIDAGKCLSVTAYDEEKKQVGSWVFDPKQTEKAETFDLDMEQQKFLRLFLLHRPNEDILKYSKDELLDFATTHGHTINYDKEKVEFIIDAILQSQTSLCKHSDISENM